MNKYFLLSSILVGSVSASSTVVENTDAFVRPSTYKQVSVKMIDTLLPQDCPTTPPTSPTKKSAFPESVTFGPPSNEALVVPSASANIKVTYNNGYFSVAKDDLSYTIPGYDLDAQLRSIIQNDQLERFLQQGYISVKDRSDGSFRLESHLRLRGGGPRWDGFKGWLVGPHPGWGVFVNEVLPKVAKGTVVVATTAIDVVRDIKKH